MVSTGNMWLAAAIRKALERVSHTTDCEVRRIHLLDSRFYLFWPEWYFFFSSLLLPNQKPQFFFLKDLILKDNLYQASSVFFLNIPLQLKRHLRIWSLFSKNCKYERGMGTKYITWVCEILCPDTKSQSLLPIGSVLVPLNPTTLTKIGLSGVLIIRRHLRVVVVESV